MADTSSIDEALADRLEPDIAQFEVNAALWRLEIDRRVRKLLEDNAADEVAAEYLQAARVTLEGVGLEISRFQDFVVRHTGFSLDLLVRLAEVATALETARRQLALAIDPKIEPERTDTSEAASEPAAGAPDSD